MSEHPTSPDAAPPVMNSLEASPRKRTPWLLLPALLLPLMVVLFLFNPAQNSFYPFCVFSKLTGLQCPGCGGLRAAHQLLHGNVLTAFRFNPLVVGALPIVLFLLVRRWVRGPGRPVSARTMAVWAWIAFAVLTVFGILRNLPIEFFQLSAG